MDVVIVESPAKAKTINKYLGKGFKVLASYGHVRDLPSKDGSVLPDNDFEMAWGADPKAQKRLNDIASAVKGADRLILATDPDREGEAISWHVLEVLNQKKALKGVDVARVVFNAITKKSVLEAMERPRGLDRELIDAYLARRALDYLVGFTLSPVLWRKLPGARSAGRVQSVALRLICDRELEIEAFRAQEYWTIATDLKTGAGTAFVARLVRADGKKLDKFDIPDKATADDLVKRIKAAKFSVTSVESKPTRRNPYPPFTTSTLQQEASRKLGFSASRTMQIAQRLYEGVEIDGETTGLITYMRTDGVQIADEAIAQARTVINNEFGETYLPSVPRQYKTKAKNAQEAHEAIRPTDIARLPKHVASRLDDDQRRLYELVWNRTVASQMESVQLERTTIEIEANDDRLGLRATGSVIVFDGFLRLYQEGRDEPDDDDDDDGRLPKVGRGDRLGLAEVRPEQHFTEPPPRFTEATLVKRMEELGIGRPSTYASTLQTLRDRGYVQMDKARFVPDDKGRLVTAFLESFFTRYVEYSFTADLEEKLDQISAGELNWKVVLRDFWKDFIGAVGEAKELRITEVLDRLNDVLGPHVFPDKGDGSDPRGCPSCNDGKLSLKVGKFGAFVGCSNYPECKFTRQLTTGAEGEASAGERVLGVDPETGKDVHMKLGRFGPYVQLGEPEAEDDKPRRASVPRKDAASIDLPRALQLLSLPRDVGIHPETGKPIVANFGRFGPFVLHDGVYANMKDPDDVYTIGLNRAVVLLAEKAAKAAERASKALRDMGMLDGKPLLIMEGKFGAYLKYGRTNATLPKGADPQALTMDEAVALIAERNPKMAKQIAKKAPKEKKEKKPAAKKAAPKKKPAAKKPAAKKAAPKKAAALKGAASE